MHPESQRFVYCVWRDLDRSRKRFTPVPRANSETSKRNELNPQQTDTPQKKKKFKIQNLRTPMYVRPHTQMDLPELRVNPQKIPPRKRSLHSPYTAFFLFLSKTHNLPKQPPFPSRSYITPPPPPHRLLVTVDSRCAPSKKQTEIFQMFSQTRLIPAFRDLNILTLCPSV
ncbi:hypothetical protein K439DRAFT_55581 [Ramaria rubella]|nr:hypothetical protein K439DRAFT_55581 [Ramaria rubella]